jgi:hypothetical protein
LSLSTFGHQRFLREIHFFRILSHCSFHLLMIVGNFSKLYSRPLTTYSTHLQEIGEVLL